MIVHELPTLFARTVRVDFLPSFLPTTTSDDFRFRLPVQLVYAGVLCTKVHVIVRKVFCFAVFVAAFLALRIIAHQSSIINMYVSVNTRLAEWLLLEVGRRSICRRWMDGHNTASSPALVERSCE